MTGPSAPQSNEAAAPTTPTRDSQRALIEHLAQAVVGTPQSPRRTASDTPRAVAVPLLYKELYKENPFSQEMAAAPGPAQIVPRADDPTNGSSLKNRAASSPDLEPLQEIESSMTPSSDSISHELLPPTDVHSNPSQAVISRKERNGSNLAKKTDMATLDSGNMSGNGTPGNHNGRTKVAGNASGALNEPFDPQRAYPSEACIFVANLLEGAPDEKLAEALTFLFGRYGTVFVKIKRKANNMPYAFVQFTNIEDAAAAMQGAKGTRVLDRVCRMEPANSKRFWLVHRADGKRSTVAEVWQALEGQGACNIKEAQPMVLEALGIDHGIRVEFPQWDQSRDLRRTISSDFVAEPLDEFALTRRQHGAAAAQARLRKTTGDDSETKGIKAGAEGKTPAEGASLRSFMERYDRDRRSIFCGNLPSNVTEAELRQAFGQTGGYIKSMEIVKCTHSAYAFIEFNRADVYETAIELLNGNDLRGMSMKIERRRARVPGASPNPFQGHRCATLPHRPGGFVSQREPYNFTPLPSPGPAQVGCGTNFQQARNKSPQPVLGEACKGSPALGGGGVAQAQAGAGLVQQNTAQYIHYLRCLMSAQQHAQQALQNAQALHGGQTSNGHNAGEASQGLRETGIQTGPLADERVPTMAEKGSGVAAGANMANPFAVPYPLLSPNGGMLPTGVQFVGLPYGSPISPTYPITPPHVLGAGNTVGHGNIAANGVDRPFDIGQDPATNTVLGQLPPNVVHIFNRPPGLMNRSPVDGGNHAAGLPFVANPAVTNGMASHGFMQGAIPDQNYAQQRINTPNSSGQGLNGGPDRGSH